MNSIINGVNTLSANMAGKSVSEVRSMLEQALNIGAQANAIVNGNAADSSYVLIEGDELEFVKAAGEKGC